MPGPEQQRPAPGPEQTPAKTPQAIFEENLRGLIEPQVTKNEQGEEVTKLPVIEDENLIRLVKQTLAFGGKTPEGLARMIDRGYNLCTDGVVKEEGGGWAQWGELVVRLEEYRALLLRIQQTGQTSIRPGEEAINPYVQTLPTEMGAAFSKGRYREQIKRGSIRGDELRPVLDVTNLEDRNKWLLLNVRTFLERDTILNPQDVWEQYTNFWVEDFKEAVTYIRKTTPQNERLVTEKQETEFIRKIKSFMAVASSATAMRFSGGDFNKYAEGITHLRGGELNLDAKDFWADSLLHGDSNKLAMVISDPLVGAFYQELIRRAGVVIPDLVYYVDKKGNKIYPGLMLDSDPRLSERELALTEWEPRISMERLFDNEGEVRKDSLLYYVKEDGGGFSDFIEKVLLGEFAKGPSDPELVGLFSVYGELEKRAAARLACDAFLVDKYTMWEYLVNRERREAFKIKPTGRDWGGNPFMSCLVPSFLVHDVKGMYQDAGEVVAKEIDKTFFPREVFNTTMTPKNLDRTARLILETLPQVEKERLSSLSSQQKSQIIAEAIKKIIPQLEGIAVEDGVYFGKSAQENGQYRLNPDFDPWQAISKEILAQADELLSLPLGQRGLMLDKISREPLSGATITAESDQKAFQEVLKFRDLVRRVIDKATKATEVEPTRPTAIEDLKKLFRYNDAISSILGGSRGESLPYWNDDTIGKLSKAIERIDDMYKGDKHVVGLIIAKIIKTKVLASVLESFSPSWRDKLGQIFSTPSGEASNFLDAEKALFGENKDARSGLVAHLMGVRRNIVIRGNHFFALEYLDQAQQLLRKAAGLGPLEEGMATNMKILSIFKNI